MTELTVAEASSRLHAGEITSTQLTQACLDRAKLFNPKINAYITIMHEEAFEAVHRRMNDVATESCSQRVVDYVLANWELIRLRKTIDDAFENYDLVVLPTMRVLPGTINEEEDPKPGEPRETSNCPPFNTFGIPAVSIPCGFSASGLPVGLMIAGPRFSEGRVLALANAYEKATQWHTRKPKLSPDMQVPPMIRREAPG